MTAALRALVRRILDSPYDEPWVLRGYGQLLRLYLDPDERVCLHLWHPRAPQPVEMHTHQLPLASAILAGRVEQYRFDRVGEQEEGASCFRRLVVPAPPSTADGVWLRRGPLEVYVAGDAYEQAPDEIHQTMPQVGAVTVLEWGDGPERPGEIFWPVDADADAPWRPRDMRPAERQEIARFVAAANATWDATG